MSNKFCWNELLSDDIEEHKEFYSKLFDWEVEVKPELDGYVIFKKDDKEIAGLIEMPKEDHDMSSCWLSYVSVEDVDAVVKKAEELGGKIHRAPMDIPNVGRVAVISDPVKGVVGLCTCKCKKESCCKKGKD